MTLDEAIKHAEEVADKKEREKQKWERWLETDSDYRAVNEKVSCELCAKEHRQLAGWLKDYKQLRGQEPKILDTLDFAIGASNGNTNYFVGFRNGLRYSKSLIDGKKPQFESCAEQEPKTNVLDKIRAEIKALSPEQTIYDIVDRNPKKDAVWEMVNDVLKIIDKYKESRDKE